MLVSKVNIAPGSRKRYAFVIPSSRIAEASSADERTGVQPLGVGKTGGSGGDGGRSRVKFVGGEGGAHPGACTPKLEQVSGQTPEANSTSGGGVYVRPRRVAVSTRSVTGAAQRAAASPPNSTLAAGTAPAQSVGWFICVKNGNASGRSAQLCWYSLARTAASAINSPHNSIRVEPVPIRASALLFPLLLILAPRCKNSIQGMPQEPPGPERTDRLEPSD